MMCCDIESMTSSYREDLSFVSWRSGGTVVVGLFGSMEG